MSRTVVFQKIYAPNARFLGKRTTSEWLEIAKAFELLKVAMPGGSRKLDYLVSNHLRPKLRVTLDDGKSFTLETCVVGVSPDGARMYLRGSMQGMTNIQRVLGRSASDQRYKFTDIVVSVRSAGEDVSCAVAFVDKFRGDVEAVLSTLREEIVGWPSE